MTIKKTTYKSLPVNKNNYVFANMPASASTISGYSGYSSGTFYSASTRFHDVIEISEKLSYCDYCDSKNQKGISISKDGNSPDRHICGKCFIRVLDKVLGTKRAFFNKI